LGRGLSPSPRRPHLCSECGQATLDLHAHPCTRFRAKQPTSCCVSRAAACVFYPPLLLSDQLRMISGVSAVTRTASCGRGNRRAIRSSHSIPKNLQAALEQLVEILHVSQPLLLVHSCAWWTASDRHESGSGSGSECRLRSWHAGQTRARVRMLLKVLARGSNPGPGPVASAC
jgi:hypothetical protein